MPALNIAIDVRKWNVNDEESGVRRITYIGYFGRKDQRTVQFGNLEFHVDFSSQTIDMMFVRR